MEYFLLGCFIGHFIGTIAWLRDLERKNSFVYKKHLELTIEVRKLKNRLGN